MTAVPSASVTLVSRVASDPKLPESPTQSRCSADPCACPRLRAARNEPRTNFQPQSSARGPIPISLLALSNFPSPPAKRRQAAARSSAAGDGEARENGGRRRGKETEAASKPESRNVPANARRASRKASPPSELQSHSRPSHWQARARTRAAPRAAHKGPGDGRRGSAARGTGRGRRGPGAGPGARGQHVKGTLPCATGSPRP